MKSYVQTIAIVLLLLFCGAAVSAQEDGEKPKPEKKKIKTMIDYKPSFVSKSRDKIQILTS